MENKMFTGKYLTFPTDGTRRAMFGVIFLRWTLGHKHIHLNIRVENKNEKFERSITIHTRNKSTTRDYDKNNFIIYRVMFSNEYAY